MVTAEQVESVLERVRPFIQADGGDVELVRIIGNSAEVKMSGRCVDCPTAHVTLYQGIELALRCAIPEFADVRLV